MKNMNKLIILVVSLLVILLIGISCNDMNDIQAEFAERDEIVYLGKVDSLTMLPGFGRAKIIWYINSDPKIEQTVIYWNMRNDSIVRNVVPSPTSDLQKDSIIIENLDESAVMFEFRNINSKGQSSLYTSITVTSWGTDFASNLLGRKLISKEFDYDLSQYKLTLSPAAVGDSVAYSQIAYTDMNGEKRTIKVERKTNELELDNFSDGSEFQFRNVFFLPKGMDTVYSSYQAHNAPKAIFENGKKLALKGNLTSRYFEREGKSLYEWNAQGDIIVYTLNEDGSFLQTETYPALVPRSTYREFFFYDDDKFIGINTDNLASIHRIENGNLEVVKAPNGALTFGSGFNMAKFLPAKGFFYSVATNGDLKTWFANNNATWGTPNGTTASTGFSYEPVAMYNLQYLVGADTNGYLWSIPTSTAGSLGSKNKIGTGWKNFVKIVPVGTKLLGLDAEGDFYEFEFNATDNYWILD